MSWESQQFVDAAQNAGIKGTNAQGRYAIDEFREYFEENFHPIGRWKSKPEVEDAARSWWRDNARHYSGNTVNEDRKRFS